MIVKALFIQFISNNYDYPEIDSVTILVTDNDIIYYEAHEIIDITIYDNRVYIIPLSENFATLNNIMTSMDGELNSNGVNFSMLDNVKMHINYGNDIMHNDYGISISCISFNILQTNCMAGLVYSNDNYDHN